VLVTLGVTNMQQVGLNVFLTIHLPNVHISHLPTATH
jgi:hypothetical protein